MLQKGFTVLEMIIVIIILTVLSSLLMVSLNEARLGGRDSQRVGNIDTMQLALAEYFRDQGAYPQSVIPGQPLVSSTVTYLNAWPTNPAPRNDGDCPDQDYFYESDYDHQERQYVSYSIRFCLGAGSGDIGPGTSYAVPGNIITCIPNCIKPCNTGSDGCGGTCANVVTCDTGETCVNDRCLLD